MCSKTVSMAICLLLLSLNCFSSITRDPKNAFNLIDEKGKTFQVRGVNRFAIYETKDNRDDMAPEAYFQFLKNSGFNVVRVFVREGFVNEGRRNVNFPIEYQLGKYSKEHIAELDQVFALARKYNMYVMLCLFDHYYLHHSWKAQTDQRDDQVNIPKPSPYYVKGTDSDWFYQSAELRKFQRARVKFLANRYRNEKHLLAFEPMNEANGVLKKSYSTERSDVVAWFEEMAKVIRTEAPRKLISLSLTGDLFWSPKGTYHPWTSLYKSDFVDIIQVHSYAFDGTWTTYLEEGFRRSILEAKKFQKPVFVGEFGVKKDNPKKYEILEAALKITQEENVPALVWTHRYDAYGELDDKTIKLFQDLWSQEVK